MRPSFPILLSPRERLLFPDCPRAVPWKLVAPHHARAERNHHQTLDRLAQRGGLSPIELRAVLRDEPCPGTLGLGREAVDEMTREAIAEILETLAHAAP